MPSFDIVIEPDVQEVDNAVNQAVKEIGQRYDFRGSKCKIEWDKKKIITLTADDDYKLRALEDIVKSKLIKRNVSIRNLVSGKVEPAADSTIRQTLTLQQGIPGDKAKQLVKSIKDANLKVQPQIQEEQIRVTGKKRDDLQEVMGLVRKVDLGLDFQFVNLRD